MSRSDLVVFVLQTKNFKHDQRIHKEARVLMDAGYKVAFVSRSVDHVNETEFKDYLFIANRLWTHNANASLLTRHFSDLVFQAYALFKLILFRYRNSNYSIVLWACDPVMFLFVRLSKLLRFGVVWDHHELPPNFFLGKKLLMTLFKSAYRKTDINIHANDERRHYLEKLIQYKSKSTLILNNLPATLSGNTTSMPVGLPVDFDPSKPFIYLQNSFDDDRGGHEIFKALSDTSYNLVCAGDFSNNQIEHFLKLGFFTKSNFFYLGFIGQDSINWLLKNCFATVILYKNTSPNQWLCDPNRLYQSVFLNAPVITGSNPTIKSFIEGVNYQRCILIEGDGCDHMAILSALHKVKDLPLPGQNSEIPLWSSYQPKILKTIDRIFSNLRRKA